MRWRPGPLDGIYLELHGAMVAVGFDDAEGELLRRVRAVVGPELPLTVSLDPHANMTPADGGAGGCAGALPHLPACRHEAGRGAGDAAAAGTHPRGKPWARAFAEIDFLIPLTMQCTMVPPMSSVLEERARLEAAHGCAELAFCFGFPYADFPGCGVAIAGYAETQARPMPRWPALKA